jgi:Fungal specific transcription factor domain
VIDYDPLVVDLLQWELAWESVHVTSPSQFQSLRTEFPPPDLAEKLVHLYFFHCNSMFPILHRPTFDYHFKNALYDREIWFACLCMEMFALASRYSDDERVLLVEPSDKPLDSDAKGARWHKAGYKYYFAVMSASSHVVARRLIDLPMIDVVQQKRSLMNPISLFEAQTLCVRILSFNILLMEIASIQNVIYIYCLDLTLDAKVTDGT